jgi:DNA-binding MarR family transcriptional regulator
MRSAPQSLEQVENRAEPVTQSRQFVLDSRWHHGIHSAGNDPSSSSSLRCCVGTCCVASGMARRRSENRFVPGLTAVSVTSGLSLFLTRSIVDSMAAVAGPLRGRSAQSSIEERVFQSLMLAADHLLRGEIEVLRVADLTFPQYNVLRILRGAQPEALSNGTISQRMLNRDSDLTRLLDKLEERGLLTRARDTRDRRVVTAEITDAGLQVLRKLDGPIDRVHREQLKHMTARQLATLRMLAEEVRGQES